MNWTHYPYAKDCALVEMSEAGGDFHKALAIAWRRADLANSRKLCATFSEDLERYACKAWRSMAPAVYSAALDRGTLHLVYRFENWLTDRREALRRDKQVIDKAAAHEAVGNDCTCGHPGGVEGASHFGITGHDSCKVVDCLCVQYTWTAPQVSA